MIPRLLLILLLSLQACTTKDYRPYPQPAGKQLGDDFLSQFQNQIQPDTAKYLLNVSIKHDRQGQSFRQAIAMQQPNKFRVETFPVQAAWASNYLISDGQNYKYYDLQSGEEDFGKYSSELFSKYFQIPVTLEEITAILSAQIPKSWVRSIGVNVFEQGGHYSFHTKDRNLFWKTGEEQRLEEFVIYRKNSERVAIAGKLTGFGERDGFSYPQLLLLEIPRHAVAIRIRVSPQGFNKVLNPEVFLIQ